MAFNLASTTAVTFGALTNKVFTFTKDLMNDGRSIRYLLTSMTGTGGFTTTHNVDAPKFILFRRSDNNRKPGRFNLTSGRYESVPRNLFVASGQVTLDISAVQREVAPFRLELSVPAGAVQYNSDQIDSFVAFIVGAINSQAPAITSAIKTGEM